MPQQYYSVDQVADLLGLHVKTVRAYVREGRLAATRIGKQYRVRRRDLEEFAGGPLSEEEGSEAQEAPHAEASTVVHVDGIDRATADRVTTLLTVTGRPEDRGRAHVQVVHDPGRSRLKVVMVGDLASTATLLGYIDSLVGDQR
ncbi:MULTISPECIES: helix-turn-helix domain-containing protein [unclassified Nocardiopsis]|uniref:helix-turn-helix domain-containing protein n=1 Tax=unclassified Nocardiopsis TaxID=2649073 RepID=UPI00066B2447|nr:MULTISPECIES: helix-turn-helix domain-containing protein [unclassified Nocardiopsis]MBQ1079860.1 helix-turn-helix domain-containing protein [Nocardiopsis sp. B62]